MAQGHEMFGLINVDVEKLCLCLQINNVVRVIQIHFRKLLVKIPEIAWSNVLYINSQNQFLLFPPYLSLSRPSFSKLPHGKSRRFICYEAGAVKT